jgi:hypothetical protein
VPEPGVVIVLYSHEHFDGIDALWDEAFPDDPPWDRAETVIPAKLSVEPELLPVAVSEARVAQRWRGMMVIGAGCMPSPF